MRLWGYRYRCKPWTHRFSQDLSTSPRGSTGDSVGSWTEIGERERGLLSVSRPVASPSSIWLVLNLVESSARNFLKWDELLVTFRSALFAVSMLWRVRVIWRWQLLSLWLSDLYCGSTWMTQSLKALLDSIRLDLDPEFQLSISFVHGYRVMTFNNWNNNRVGWHGSNWPPNKGCRMSNNCSTNGSSTIVE